MFDALRLTLTKVRRRLFRQHEPVLTEQFDFTVPQLTEDAEDLQAWRARVLDGIREHIAGTDVYRHDTADLQFAAPAAETDPCGREERPGFGLERVFKGDKDTPGELGAEGIAQALIDNAHPSARARRRARAKRKCRYWAEIKLVRGRLICT